jgi:hypothetical protein
LSAKDIEKNIVGTWIRTTSQGEDKLRFMDDKAYDATSPIGLVTKGTYYFEDGEMFSRTQTLLGNFENKVTVVMDSKDSLWISLSSGDAENYTRKK